MTFTHPVAPMCTVGTVATAADEVIHAGLFRLATHAGKPGDPAWEQHVALMTEVYDNPAAAEYDHIRERADAAAFTRYVEGVHDDVKGVVRYVKVRTACPLP